MRGFFCSIFMMCMFLFAAACSSPEVTPDPTTTNTPKPTETPSPTSTPTSSPTPTSTPTPEPTLTPIPEPTAVILPRVRVIISPSSQSDLSQRVVLPGEEFDVVAEIKILNETELDDPESRLSFAWDYDGDLTDGVIDATVLDPKPATLSPGIYNPILTVHYDLGSEEAPEVVHLHTARGTRMSVVGEPFPDWQFGVMAHVDLGHQLYEDETEIVIALDLIKEAGIEVVVVVDFTWAAIESRENQFNWAEYDRMVELLRERDLKMFAKVAGIPRWAAQFPDEELFWLTAMREDAIPYFERYVEKLFSRYPDINTVQFINEPNIERYFKGGSPELYVEVLQRGYLAAKLYNPDVIIALGGTANGPAESRSPGYEPDDFLDIVFTLLDEESIRQPFDAVSINPYTDPYWHGFTRLQIRLDDVRRVLDAHEVDKPIIIGEYGWYTTGIWTEQMVANWLVQSFDLMFSSDDIAAVSIYNFRNKGTNPQEPEHNYGLVDRSFTPKQTYFTYQEYITKYRSEEPDE